MSANPEPAVSPASALSYQDAVSELEAIVSDLDEGAVDVDTLSKQFQRAIDIVEDLDARITKTKAQVEKLAPRLDAIGSSAAVSGAEEEAF